MNPYLSFKGDCEAPFTLYARCLGGQLGTLFRYGGTPLATQVPADWSDKIMHGSVMVGDQVMMGGDVAPDRYEEPRGFSMSLRHTMGYQLRRRSVHERVTFHRLDD
jgi:PhnB protein